jgi:hypothetical protein
VVAYVLSLPALASDPPTKDGQPNVLAEFNIAKGGRPITLPVKIREREYLFLLDTGTSYSTFDTSLTNLLGTSVGVRPLVTLGGPIKAPFFDPPEAFLGPLDLRQGGLINAVDLENFRRVIGRDVRGMLGMGFLKNYVVRVDFDSAKLQFRRWDGRSHPEWGTAVHLVKPTEDNILPFANARPPWGGNMLFCVDSGCDSSVSMVTNAFARATDQAVIAQGLAATAAGVRHDRSGRLTSLTLGGFEHRGLVVNEDNSNVIGLRILSHYVVTFDFPGMKMYLQKGQAFDKPDEVDMSGLHLWCIGDRITVHAVDDGSPASTAGIKPEDVVLKVGEQSASAIDIYDLRDLLKSGDGKEIKMTLKRGEEQKVVTFTLKQPI